MPPRFPTGWEAAGWNSPGPGRPPRAATASQRSERDSKFKVWGSMVQSFFMEETEPQTIERGGRNLVHAPWGIPPSGGLVSEPPEGGTPHEAPGAFGVGGRSLLPNARSADRRVRACGLIPLPDESRWKPSKLLLSPSLSSIRWRRGCPQGGRGGEPAGRIDGHWEMVSLQISPSFAGMGSRGQAVRAPLRLGHRPAGCARTWSVSLFPARHAARGFLQMPHV